MQAPDSIETILSRLMPPALSQGGQFEIDAMIDELAGPEREVVVPISSGKWMVRAVTGGGIAAAVAGLLALVPMSDGFPRSEAVKVAASVPEFMLVSESDRVESMTDEGWQEDLNGSAMHALRLVAVEENHVKDTESGMVMMISETREEILYSPINAF
ncbi:MAG: hypothetical protein ACRCXD_06865 [Luteolibacter sp.]